MVLSNQTSVEQWALLPRSLRLDQCCIDRLPFPNLIQVPKIHIKKYTGIRDDPLPTILDYETLSRALRPLCKDGLLRTITLEVSMDGNHYLNDKPDSARESSKLKAGLAALLPANISDLQFIMDRTHFSTWMSRNCGFDMCCAIEILPSHYRYCLHRRTCTWPVLSAER